MDQLNVARLEDFDFSGMILIPSKNDPNTLYMVAIVAEWCGHCKKFVPEYEKISNIVKEGKVGKVMCCIINCSGDVPNDSVRQSEINLAKSVKKGDIIPGFKGFPSLCFFKNGKYIEEYNGPRTVDAIITKLKDL